MEQNSNPLNSTRKNLVPIWIRTVSVSIPLLFLIVFFLWPVLNLTLKAVEFENFTDTFSDSDIFGILCFTFAQALISTSLTVVIGFFPTLLVSRYNFVGKRVLSAILVIPFIMPSVVAASSFRAILPNTISETAIAVVIVHVFLNIAVIVKIVGPTMKIIPEGLFRASKTLGANRLQNMRYVLLPIVSKSYMSAATIVFVFCFTSYGVIKVIGGRNSTIETEIARQALFEGNINSAAILTILQMLVLGVIFGTSFLYSRKDHFELQALSTENFKRSSSSKNLRLTLLSFITGSIICLPFFVMFTKSFRIGDSWSLTAWKNLRGYEIRPGIGYGIDPLVSIFTSIKIALVCVSLSMTLGLLIVLVARHSRFLPKVISAFSLFPLITSAVTIGLGIFLTFSNAPVDWRNSWLIVPIGHTLIALPFVIRIISHSSSMSPTSLDHASYCLGASPTKTLFKVNLPILKPAILYSSGISAAISLGEFGATSFLSRTGSETMPITIADLISRTGDIPRAQAFMMSSILAVLCAGIVFLIEVRDARN